MGNNPEAYASTGRSKRLPPGVVSLLQSSRRRFLQTQYARDRMLCLACVSRIVFSRICIYKYVDLKKHKRFENSPHQVTVTQQLLDRETVYLLRAPLGRTERPFTQAAFIFLSPCDSLTLHGFRFWRVALCRKLGVFFHAPPTVGIVLFWDQSFFKGCFMVSEGVSVADARFYRMIDLCSSAQCAHNIQGYSR